MLEYRQIKQLLLSRSFYVKAIIRCYPFVFYVSWYTAGQCECTEVTVENIRSQV